MNKTTFSEDFDQKTLTIERTFEAPIARVWAAWTQSELLEKWWAPAPWKARTKSFDFSEGGHWHYYMEGPEGERHWSLVQYRKIEPQESFTGFDTFCDEHGTRNEDLPAMEWDNRFKAFNGHTEVRVIATFVSAEDLKRIVEMGVKEGFTTAMDQLEALLSGNA
jgi:uncharacterized protein YndB with AHSA1/START domain